MDSNNSGFLAEDKLDESNFSVVSSNGMDMKRIFDKIQNLEDMVMKKANTNNGDQSGIIQMFWQMGKQIGELKNKMDGMNKIKEKLNGIKKENVEQMTKISNIFEDLKKEVGKLNEENGKLGDENAMKNFKIEEMKKALEELKSSMAKESRAFEEENRKLKEALTENGRILKEMNKEMVELKSQIARKDAEINRQIVAMKEEDEKVKAKTRELETYIKELNNVMEIDGIEWVKFDSNAYKWNEADCGTKIRIFEDGFVAKYSVLSNGINCARANLSIPKINLNLINKPTISFYYEVKILKTVG